MVPVAMRLPQMNAWLDERLEGSAWRSVDRAVGAATNIALGICVGWFIAALAAIAPGESQSLNAVRGSAMLGALVESVPPQGTLGALLLRSGLAPGVNGPLVLAREPDPSTTRLPAVRAAAASVVQVRGTACDFVVSGTGWVAGNGIVVTNAHVVAGTQRSWIAGGPEYDGAAATVTAFDPVNDIAVLVLEAGSAQLPPPLTLNARVAHDEPVAVIGFPLGHPKEVVPGRIDRVATYDVEPLGGGARRPARVLALRAAVQPGNSGGPVLAQDGSVLGMIVSQAIGQRVDAAYGVASSDLLTTIAAGSRRVPADTGPCLDASDLQQDIAARVPSGTTPIR